MSSSPSLQLSVYECNSQTFKEAVFAVHHIDPSPLQAGGTVNLAVVLVKPAIWATHWHKGGSTLFLANALGTASFCHQHALSTPSTVGPPTGTFFCVGKGWKRERKGWWVKFNLIERGKKYPLTLTYFVDLHNFLKHRLAHRQSHKVGNKIKIRWSYTMQK